MRLIAEMSEKISALHSTSAAQQYFADQFRSLFNLNHCAIYRVSENEELFIRSFEVKHKKRSPLAVKYEQKLRPAQGILSGKEEYIFCSKKSDLIKDEVNFRVLNELTLTVRRSAKAELIFYAIIDNEILVDEIQNDVCRIFSNFYLQVEDSLKIRNKISDKQQELSGKISENNDTLFQMNERLVRYNQELQQFAYSASHDLQEPLRTISSYINLFLRNYNETLTDDGREYLQYASDGAQRMHQLIKDLLVYSKLDYKEEPMTEFEGSIMLREALNNLQLAVEESNALILYTDLPVLYGNHSQVILLFQNLIDNAIKFRSKSEPLVFIDVEDKNDLWEFKIKDNGIGIPQQFQNKIFGFFNRLHARDEIKGSGLGLSICKKIVERHHGNIFVESRPGKGSTFTFSLSKSV
ncbi:MAG: ATP-binding protein [Chitinophagales bacterium]